MATVVASCSSVPPQRICWKMLREPPVPYCEDLAGARTEGPGPRSQGCSQLMMSTAGRQGPGHLTSQRRRPLWDSLLWLPSLSAETSSELGYGLRLFLPPPTCPLPPRGQAHTTEHLSPLPQLTLLFILHQHFPQQVSCPLSSVLAAAFQKTETDRRCAEGWHPLSALSLIIITYLYYPSNLERTQFSSHCTREETKHDGDEQLAPQSRG